MAHSVVSAAIDATPGVSAAMAPSVFSAMIVDPSVVSGAMAPSVVSAMVVDPFLAAMAHSVVSPMVVDPFFAAIDFFSDVQISWPWRQGCQTQALCRLRIELFVGRI